MIYRKCIKITSFGNNVDNINPKEVFYLIKKVEISGVNTSKLPVLSNEEKQELLIRIKTGDEEARQIFINSNLKLVLSVIKRFANRNENADDLFQVGCVGLIKAIDNFDLSQGVLFSTYAVPMIIGEIRRYLRDNNAIRVSRSLRDIAYKALQIKERILNKENREATIEEVAKEIEVSKEELTYALDAIQEPVSLYEPIYNDGADALFIVDQIGDEKNIDENWVENIAINEGLKKLKDREKMIIKKRFFDGKTQMEVAEEIGISQAQVSRLEKTALLHMRKALK